MVLIMCWGQIASVMTVTGVSLLCKKQRSSQGVKDCSVICVFLKCGDFSFFKIQLFFTSLILISTDVLKAGKMWEVKLKHFDKKRLSISKVRADIEIHLI